MSFRLLLFMSSLVFQVIFILEVSLVLLLANKKSRFFQFCGAKATDKDHEVRLLSRRDRISADEFSETRKPSHLLVDVRTEPEMSICSIENSVNIPMDQLDKEETLQRLRQLLDGVDDDGGKEIVVVCRRGNDSQIAVRRFQEKLGDPKVRVRDMIGGLHAWAKTVDPTFPVY